MSTNSRKVAYYTREKAKVYQQIIDFIENDKSYLNDPVWQRAVEIARSKHKPWMEAFKLAEQEFDVK